MAAKARWRSALPISTSSRGRATTTSRTVRQRLFHGDFVQYVIDSAPGPLIVRRPPVNLLDEGAAVTLSFSPEHCVLLARRSSSHQTGTVPATIT